MALENTFSQNGSSFSPESDGKDISASDLMLSRRSVRSGFIDTKIPDNVVQLIVDCGLSAPSSKNAQPWRLHVVQDRPMLTDIAEKVIAAQSAAKFVPQDPRTGEARKDLPDTVEESAHVLRQAPLGIFIENLGKFSVSRKTVANSAPQDREGALIGVALEYIGLGACIENMWLAAEENGVRGVFMGDCIIAEDAIRSRLEMTGDLVGVLALGYTVADPRDVPRQPDRVVYHT